MRPTLLRRALHLTVVLHRPQTIKPNPHQTTAGQYDKSFERVTNTIESRLLFRQENFPKMNLYDGAWGEETQHQLKQAAKEDVTGQEPETPGARQARSFFIDKEVNADSPYADFGINNKNYYSPTREAWREKVRSNKNKISKIPQKLSVNKNILEQSEEPAEYYYPMVSLEEKKRKNRMMAAAGVAVVIVSYECLSRLGEYMRTAG
ncbi:hypothetical protein AGDE_01337 [Angomonas deanei]|uniref:Uncharacterized protein n=1 Tax=Angomonas deanei TaxID=59799 RepID=S9WYK7_9TRYP|nr:hypothetical protein AGDE_02800 [Angomonas deanei]EPY42586.1 hypothetical protein AGDE_01337 [Angomonas deanei]CAD2214584.1 hypothetical protein, conserved [Angomonas deanei]|eukprot:EPY41125.1 hypothetical protein AGDE_02800 [Angomonas deanei]